jgi:hypothetical protein
LIEANSLKNETTHMPVAHTCNPSYSGGRDQEDHSLKPAWVNSFYDPISKNTQHKKGLVTYTCNLSHSGGRDQEDGGLKPAQANSSQDTISKKLITQKKVGLSVLYGRELA